MPYDYNIHQRAKMLFYVVTTGGISQFPSQSLGFDATDEEGRQEIFDMVSSVLVRKM